MGSFKIEGNQKLAGGNIKVTFFPAKGNVKVTLHFPGVRGEHRWDTDPDEFKAFLSLIVLTGIMGWASRDEMFRRGQREVQFVHNLMTNHPHWFFQK